VKLCKDCKWCDRHDGRQRMSDIESDVAAAKLLGKSIDHAWYMACASGTHSRYRCICGGDFIVRDEGCLPSNTCTRNVLSLSNPSHRDAVVQVLGNAYDVYLMPVGNNLWDVCVPAPMKSYSVSNNEPLPYEEAIRAAVIEMVG